MRLKIKHITITVFLTIILFSFTIGYFKTYSGKPIENSLLLKQNLDKMYGPAVDKIYYGTNDVLSDHFNDEEMINKYRNTTSPSMLKRFPRVICIGTVKSGTQALLEFLGLHPQIRSVPREILYFKYGDKFDVIGFEKYLKMMPYSTKHQITFEKGPQFATIHSGFDNRIPQRIHDFDPSIKLLFIVKDPIDRALSEYLHNERVHKNKNRTFQELVMRNNGMLNMFYAPIQNSMYFKILQKWYKYFSKDQIHIVDGQQLRTHPSEELTLVENFLNITHRLTADLFYFNKTKGFYCYHTEIGSKKCLWPTKGNKHPAIQKELLTKLKRFFAPQNQKFYKLVGRKFDWM